MKWSSPASRAAPTAAKKTAIKQAVPIIGLVFLEFIGQPGAKHARRLDLGREPQDKFRAGPLALPRRVRPIEDIIALDEDPGEPRSEGDGFLEPEVDGHVELVAGLRTVVRLDEEGTLVEPGDDDLPGEGLPVIVFNEGGQAKAPGRGEAPAKARGVGPVEAQPAPGFDGGVRVVIEGADDAVIVLVLAVPRACLAGGLGRRRRKEKDCLAAEFFNEREVEPAVTGDAAVPVRVREEEKIPAESGRPLVVDREAQVIVIAGDEIVPGVVEGERIVGVERDADIERFHEPARLAVIAGQAEVDDHRRISLRS